MTAFLRKREYYQTQIRSLQAYLGIRERPEDDLIALEDARVPDSCQWFTGNQSFREWRDNLQSHARHYWLSGKPATGKSVLAGTVIDNLEDLNLDCSYYFFHHNDVSKSSPSGCLRSLAFQMALSNLKIRQKLLEMIADDIYFELNDDRVIWRKIFVNGIFQTERSNRPHYWVLDALDECNNYGALFPLLAKAEAPFPLKVFITSRSSNDCYKHFGLLGNTVVADQIDVSDTLRDIELYVQARIEHLPLDQDRLDIVNTIIKKSSGCFLWVVLVLEELRKVYTQSDILQVLEEVPPGMESLYQRTFKIMSETVRSKALIKAILLWVMCATRPLSISELTYALNFDPDITVSPQALESSITTECGQLLFIDKSNKIQIVHQTLREYLLSKDHQSEFKIRGADGHTLLASTCLKYLNSEEMRPPRNYLLVKVASRLAKRSAFLEYASYSFNDHLRRTHSGDDALLALLDQFLRTNILSWIETIATSGDLSQITRTAKHMKGFLNARAKHKSPIGLPIQRVDMWANDLIRIVAKFGEQLVSIPSAIYYLIPPFCPPKSAIASQFGAPSKGIALTGLPKTDWDDRLFCVSYGKKQAVAIAYAEKRFAVALSDKTVITYHALTFQESKILSHAEPIKLLLFSPSGTLLACSGRKRIQVWDLVREEKNLVFNVAHEPLSLIFLEQETILKALTRGNTMYSWGLLNGSTEDMRVGKNPFEEETDSFRRPLTSATCSGDLAMAAVVYRGRPICLFDLNYDIFFGCCSKDPVAELDDTNLEEAGVTPVLDLVFNSNPEVSLLAATYIDGDLALFEPCELSLLSVVQADATVLSCSPDGRTLATGSSDGVIQLHEFETLRLLYRIQADDYAIRAIAFSSDSLRFIDVRGPQSSVWESSVLVRSEGAETESVSDITLPVPQTIETDEIDSLIEITCIVCHDNGRDVFCGKDDGTVAVYDAATGQQSQTLYQHIGGVAILQIIWGKKEQRLATADASSSIIVRKLKQASKFWEVQDLLLDVRIGYSVSQLLLDPENTKLLASTAVLDTSWDLESQISTTQSFTGRLTWRWVNHPVQSDSLILLDSRMTMFKWDKLEQTSRDSWMEFSSDKITEAVPGRAEICGGGRFVAINFESQSRKQSTNELLLFASSHLQSESKSVTPLAEFRHISAHVKHLIGTFGSKILFLDYQLWVCSLSLLEQKGKVSRHFFLPDEWITTTRHLLCEVTSQGSLVFVKHDALAIVHRGLKFEEVISEPTVQRPRGTLPLLHKAQSAPD